jgi:hypothetical protein
MSLSNWPEPAPKPSPSAARSTLVRPSVTSTGPAEQIAVGPGGQRVAPAEGDPVRVDVQRAADVAPGCRERDVGLAPAADPELAQRHAGFAGEEAAGHRRHHLATGLGADIGADIGDASCRARVGHFHDGVA